MNLIGKAIALLEEEGWCQRVSRDESGRFCLLGAIEEAGRLYGDSSYSTVIDKLYAHPSIIASSGSISAWNDAPVRSRRQVIALLGELA